ncbi:16S rRNA (cytosine(1402)-N(4))-methyltransferase RsmH [Spiroplasma endosymbiont of Polydrusus pterygomalis]|uniref:16S rRNA (cytosine(1402)-N(4))-methyltransferase RsmH n=1 Tax=Spiroplasma endosymbiont of Polydrusus pterygomalis TaxID=3139327 RepID=UPI003CCB4612
MNDINTKHIAVMLTEAINFLNIKPDGIYVDCTLGRAGHSKVILSKLTSGKLYAFDQDQTAIDNSNIILKDFKNNYEIIKSNFASIRSELLQRNVTKVDGILYDLGVSSPQVDDDTRGFSYMKDAKLDMRMDQSQELNAWEIVNNYSYQQLKSIIKNYGEEVFASRIAKNIIKARTYQSIDTTLQLVAIIKKSLPVRILNKHHHPAKKTFQALRIAVNNELASLKSSLQQSLQLLKTNGRIVVITFHSLEDRIVKQTFNNAITDPQAQVYAKLPIYSNWQTKYQLILKKPLVPKADEIAKNPRARSAKLRVITYIDL